MGVEGCAAARRVGAHSSLPGLMVRATQKLSLPARLEGSEQAVLTRELGREFFWYFPPISPPLM